jgi:tripartite-type tricarboxylate transporter receptor subunit TctC
MKPFYRNRFLLLGLALLPCLSAVAQSPANFPVKPIKIIVGYTPGGANDILARIIGQKMQDSFGQPVLVENRPSAGAIVGADFVAKSPADGYTLLMGASGPIVFNPALYSKLPYSPLRDFAPVSIVGYFPLVLSVQANSDIKTLADLIAFTKANPGKANYGSSAASFRLATEMLKGKTGIQGEHIPFKGSMESVNAVVAGHVTMTLVDSGPATGALKGGLLRGLAVTSAKRVAALPDVPTMTEQGIDLTIQLWSGLLAPAGTPAAIVAKLSQEVARIVKLPDVRERMAALSIEPEGGTPEQFSNLIAAEIPIWTAVARANNITGD